MIASGAASAVITALLLATGAPDGKPVAFAAFFTPAGPSICAQVSEELNAQRQSPTDPEFYCNE